MGTQWQNRVWKSEEQMLWFFPKVAQNNNITSAFHILRVATGESSSLCESSELAMMEGSAIVKSEMSGLGSLLALLVHGTC